ncbi:metal ABC transporter ATP-binding protein [Candidatus Uabimicrobium sp. HlEnr_7]|uniref:metal ABC transporter ATP-binding protein n=1 Tax=Candidatus Uabimicrobium helgolandensis TaxID=3095367 RepID=UPI0035562A59
MNKVIDFQKVDLGYGKVKILSDVNLTIYNGEYCSIIGTNGCGKSTLLKSMMSIIKPLSGSIVISQTKMGYVPQNNVLDPLFPLTVFEVVKMGLYGQMGLFKHIKKKHTSAILQVIKDVQLQGKENNLFRDLSGGQRQKVLIARALISQPNCLILDEPTSGIDIPSQHEILNLIKQLHQEQDVTIIMVSHDLNIVMKYSQSVAIIHNGVLQHGQKEEIMTTEKLTKIYNYQMQVVNQVIVGIN